MALYQTSESNLSAKQSVSADDLLQQRLEFRIALLIGAGGARAGHSTHARATKAQASVARSGRRIGVITSAI